MRCEILHEYFWLIVFFFTVMNIKTYCWYVQDIFGYTLAVAATSVKGSEIIK